MTTTPAMPELLRTSITPRPLRYSLNDYHNAPSEGPLHATWEDKPHRLLYDLIAAVSYYSALQAQPAATTKVGAPSGMLRTTCPYCENGFAFEQPAAAGVSDADLYGTLEPTIVSRYVVEKRVGGGFWGYCVKAGDGAQEIFVGHKNACEHVRQALQTACLDGAYMAHEKARAILALRPQAVPVGRAVDVDGEIRLLPYDEDPATSPLSDGSEVFCAPLNLNCKSVQKRLMAQWGYEVQPAREPMTDTERADMICAVAAICTGTSSRNLAATAIEWTERRYGITAPAGGEKQA